MFRCVNVFIELETKSCCRWVFRETAAKIRQIRGNWFRSTAEVSLLEGMGVGGGGYETKS